MAILSIPGVKTINASEAEEAPLNLGIFGPSQAGKTQLLASIAKFYQEQGLTVLYLATPNEDPYTTLSQFDLGSIVVPIDKAATFDKVAESVQRSKQVDVVLLDSLNGLSRMTMDRAIGVNRYPADSKEWAPTHDAFFSAVVKLKDMARISVFACAADRSADSFATPDAKKPNLIACDLPGKMATGISGAVSGLGYVQAELDDEKKVFNRSISFVPAKGTITFLRGLKRPMVEPIPLTSFHDGWTEVVKVINEHKAEVTAAE